MASLTSHSRLCVLGVYILLSFLILFFQGCHYPYLNPSPSVEYHLAPTFNYEKMLSLEVNFYGATLAFNDKETIDLPEVNKQIVQAGKHMRPGLSLKLFPSPTDKIDVSSISVVQGQVELKTFENVLDSDNEKYILEITFDSYVYCTNAKCGGFHTLTSIRGKASIFNATTHERKWEASTKTEIGENPGLLTVAKKVNFMSDWFVVS